MKWTEERIIKVTMWKCDLCDFQIEDNRGCCGTAPIMQCRMCGKHACREHRAFFTEEQWADYPHGFYACSECEEEAREAWDNAVEEAGRHEDILDVVKDRIDASRHQRNYDRGIEHVPFDWYKGE